MFWDGKPLTSWPKKRIAGSAQRKPTQEVPWNMFYWFLTTSEKKQEFKVQTPHRRGIMVFGVPVGSKVQSGRRGSGGLFP